MAGDENLIEKESIVYSIKTSLKYERNLQTALDFCSQNWDIDTMLNFYLQVNKEIDKLAFFPYSNPQNRFLNDTNCREIILRKFPYTITYHIDKNVVKIINIVHTSRNPIRRKAKQ